MTLREWTREYQGTYYALMFLSIVISAVIRDHFFSHSVWPGFIAGLIACLATQFLLTVLAWQITEFRRQNR